MDYACSIFSSHVLPPSLLSYASSKVLLCSYILDLLKETKNDLSKDDIAVEYWLEEVRIYSSHTF